MSKSFSNPSRMSFGSSGFGHGLDSDFKMGQQRSHGISPGSSPQSSQSTFRLGGRGPASSHTSRESDHINSLLASFGLSSSDLDELSRFPEDKITAENLPEIIQHLERRRSDHTEMSSNRERFSRDDLGPVRRASFGDGPSGLNPLGNNGHGGSFRAPDYHERHIDASGDRERRVDRFLSELSFRKSESNYDRTRGMPSSRNIDDFHGLEPKVYPHVCSICDMSIYSLASWHAHSAGKHHQQQRQFLLHEHPQWGGHGMGGSPRMAQPSPNRAPGNMGPPPYPMGGPGVLRRNQGRPGMGGPRQIPKKQPFGKVVHVLGFERKRTLKMKLWKLFESFGAITNLLILNTKNEAFIEMATVAQAKAAVNYFATSPARVYGKPVKVFLSKKYPQVKKGNDGKTQQMAPKRQFKLPKKPFQQGPKQPTEGIGRVLRICQLPKSGCTDRAILSLAKRFGSIKNYILIRKFSQAFVEMEKAEDAQAVVDRYAKTPLKFKGKPIKILISQKYKTLVLRIPRHTENRKPYPTSYGGKKKLGARTDDFVTEEDDLVTDSCEPEEEEEEEEEEAAAEQSGTGHKAEVPDGDLDQNNRQSERAPAFHDHKKGFVSLDEMGSDTVKKENGVVSEQPAEEMEVDGSTVSQTAPGSKDELASEEPEPYQPNVPTGVDYVIPKTGFYCKLCSLFYTNEKMAKVTHCSSLAHYQKLMKIKRKPVEGKSPEKKNEN